MIRQLDDYWLIARLHDYFTIGRFSIRQLDNYRTIGRSDYYWSIVHLRNWMIGRLLRDFESFQDPLRVEFKRSYSSHQSTLHTKFDFFRSIWWIQMDHSWNFEHVFCLGLFHHMKPYYTVLNSRLPHHIMKRITHPSMPLHLSLVKVDLRNCSPLVSHKYTVRMVRWLSYCLWVHIYHLWHVWAFL